ncbi:TetR/AcrR family transcriptional regulator [Allopusillimonas ginsengisoli]|uniref:TetR/AcrR family transcriptional regulator n=1 Tax=Allopusillimonas ginsengisoli TaxID=453575 RepID=UPI0010205CDF|nr:TetR/AcrR family transcriptional regulator [Allopusillimonas ginsengisoli]TEA77217.1 TetR/AcrR family transcriptional regulator [Allopusillimonas ginsengisoli]
MSTSKSVKTRRRGAELEQAIIEVAWSLLLKHGYSGLTMEAVASAAHTSRSVLARRWRNKADLAVAAIQQQLVKHSVEPADRGDVRAELLDYLDHLGSYAPTLLTVFSLLSSDAFRETYASANDLRRALTTGKTSQLALILRRAVDRQEIDPAKLVAPVDTLLIDLIRHHVLMNRKAPPKKLCAAWVDTIFLPLVRQH